MANHKAPKYLEHDLDEYVAAAIDQADLHITPLDFWSAASEQRTVIRRADDQANFCVSLGGAFLLLGLPAWYYGIPGKPVLLGIAAISTAVAFVLCKTGFRRNRWQRFLTLGGMKSLEFRLSREFEIVFAQVKSLEHQILEIDKSGIGTFNSPVSHQPVAKTYGPEALDDIRFPVTLFQANIDIVRKIVIVVPAPSGDWFNFYVWNEPVGSQIEDLFDETPDIYPHDPIKRLKAKVAICTVASFVIQQKLNGRKFNSKDVVVGLFQQALKLRATTLRQSGKITELQEQHLCRLNITGAAPSNDPIDVERRKAPKPESWFLNMMSGDYDPILRPLAGTIEDKRGTLPSFVTR